MATICDRWLLVIRDQRTPERFRIRKRRLEHFVRFVGTSLRVRQLKATHVEN